MSTAALVIGIVGVVLATLSLVWQAAAYFMTGPRIDVRLKEGLRKPNGGILGAPPSIYTEAGRQTLMRGGFTERVLIVNARNVGRMPATIRMWSLRVGNGALFTLPQHPQNRAVPCRLDAHDDVTWSAPLDQLRALQANFFDQSDRAATVVAVLDLAMGKQVESRQRLVVRADAGVADCTVVRAQLAWLLTRIRAMQR